MGRPPIGKVAMTGAERTRLYRLKHASTKPATKTSSDTATLVQEIARLKAELAQVRSASDNCPKELLTTAQQKLDAYKARVAQQFTQRVNDEVIRRIAAADDATRAENKQLRKEVHSLERFNQQLAHGAVFTKTQFRHMQMLCHPDNSASPQLRAQLSQILVENERRLVKPDGETHPKRHK